MGPKHPILIIVAPILSLTVIVRLRVCGVCVIMAGIAAAMLGNGKVPCIERDLGLFRP